MIPYFTFDTIHLGSFTVYVWGLFAGLAFAAALYIALKEGKRKNISKDVILDLSILILIGGVFGARIAYVFENWSEYSGNLGEIFKLSEGGLMFYGGLAGAFIAAFAYIKFKKLSFWKVADTIAPSLAIGEFIGRIGCSLADLHIGSITTFPWGQQYIDGSTRHPIGIYMALNGLFMFAALWILRFRLKVEGSLFLFLLLWYSGTRFFLDFLRCADLAICDPRYNGFTPSQYISAVLFLSSLILITKMLRLSPSRILGPKASSISSLSKGFERKEKIMTEQDKQDLPPVTPPPVNPEIITAPDTEKSAIKKLSDSARELSKKPHFMTVVIFILGLAIGAGALYGFSSRMFQASVFSFQGKTWVSYSDPVVKLTVVNDKNCAACDTADLVKQLKTNAVPTLVVSDVDFASKEGKAVIERFGVKSLPALVFDSNIEKTAIFQQISPVLVKKDAEYYVNPAISGIPQGRLLAAPGVTPQDRVKGPANAPVTILEFSDFECPYCKMASGVVKEVLAAYPDKVKLVYRHFPLRDKHPDAQYAAEAAECAGDQGKFWEISDVIFANQEKLSAADIDKYAKDLSLDMGKFGDCLKAGKFKTKIDADVASGGEYGISGTPSFFVGNEFVSGGSTVEDFKALIDEQLKGK